MNLKFKTLASDGLIFYAANLAESIDASYLSLVNGQLVFISQGEEVRSSSSDVKFNDNEWHVVTATYDGSALSLNIDDTKSYSTDTTSPFDFHYGNLYIGGVPSTLDPDSEFVPFVGCIGDTTLNGNIINFANTTERLHAILGKCKGGDQTRMFRYK